MKNLYKHIENIKEKYGLNVIVGINKFNTDTEKEISFLVKQLENKGIQTSIVEAWEKGGKGAIDIAEKLTKLVEIPEKFKYIYELNDSIETKIEKISKEIYGADGVEFSNESIKSIKKIEELGYGNLPVCIAKTQYSLSDEPTNLECNEPFTIKIREINLKAGAGFIVAIAGNIMTMPGLPKIPAAEKIDIDENENIIGLS